MASATHDSGIVEVDLAPDESYEALRERLRSRLRDNPRMTIGQATDGIVPSRLTEEFYGAIGAAPNTRGSNLSSKALNQLVGTIKGWNLGAVRAVPLERGEVVAGGVSLAEVDPQTMQSRLVAGLYLCGEVLDIAGPVGGYNLQAAWSTGFVAGESAARAPIP
jgi:hypothetical protein